MITAQTYCTLQEVMNDLSLDVDETGLFGRVQQASRFLQRRLGNFIPITEQKKYTGRDSASQQIDPCLAVTAVSHYGGALTALDYFLYPENRHWPNGPFTRIERYIGTFYSWPDQTLLITGRWGKYEETADTGLTASQLIGDTTLTVASPAILSPGMVLLIESEQEHILSVGPGGIFNVARGVNGTVAAAHSTKAISKYVVPEDLNYLCREMAVLMRMKQKTGFSGRSGNADSGETFYINEFPSAIKQLQQNYRIVQI